MSKIEPPSRPKRKASVAKKNTSRTVSAAKKRGAEEDIIAESEVNHSERITKKVVAVKKTKTSSVRIWVALVGLATLLTGALILSASGGGTTAPSISPCAAEEYAATQNPIAAALLSRRDRISGVHVINPDALAVSLAFLKPSKCHTQIVEAHKPFSDLLAFRSALTGAFTSAKRGATCIVWVVDLHHVEHVGGALKELLESNSLRGEPVVPGGKRGLLILKSTLSREELKDRLPHRVVHMFRSVELPN